MKKCILFLAMLLALCFALTGCDSGSSGGDDPVPPPAPAAVESVSLNAETLVIKTGTEVTLGVTVLPENAADKSVRWINSNPNAVVIDGNGKATGVANGSSTITVVTNDGDKTATCAVTVSDNVWTVSFDVQGCGTAVEDHYALKNGKVSKPVDPKADGYIFGAWYKDPACMQLWDFAKDTVTADMTLYAKWISADVPCKVSFDGNGRTGTMDPVLLEKDDPYIIPASAFVGVSFTPEVAGALGKNEIFTGWNTKADGSGVAYRPGMQLTVPKDITLYAQWGKPVFSVGNGKKVLFSKGNLYWTGSKFNFETSQYGRYTSWSTSHVSHFYWSKTESVAYAKEYSDSSAAIGDILFTNATATTPKPDFTVSDVTGKYRALSVAEFEYLLNLNGKTDGTARNQANRFAYAMVNYVKGLLIFPDGYVLPSGYTVDGGKGMSGVNNQWGYVNENIPTAIWTIMESNGVVFLPITGIRLDNSISSSDYMGRCWLSESSDDNNSRAYNVDLSEEGIGYISNWNARSEGDSVRLVCDYDEN